MLKRSQMHSYQEKMIKKGKEIRARVSGRELRYMMLCMDMGLGKTVTAATTVVDLMNLCEIGKCLIVAPKLVATVTWPDEFGNWEHLSKFTYSVIQGNVKQRIAAMMKPADFHIISRDNFAWLVKVASKVWIWDALIWDESDGLGDPSSRRTQALFHIRRKLDYIQLLSATPGGLLELWPQISVMDGGQRLEKTISGYRTKYFNRSYDGYGYEPKKYAAEIIHEKIKDVAFHLAAEDYLKMPERIIRKIPVKLTAAEIADYKKFSRNMMIEFDGKVIDATNRAVLAGKQLQYANGAMYTDELKNYHVIHDHKIEKMKELVECAGGTPVMIAYNFKSDLARLKRVFPKAKVMDGSPETQKRWNNREIPILLVHPESAGHGLNLQGGGNIILWLGPPYSLRQFTQLCGRLYRQGQKEASVIILVLVSTGTNDERAVSVLTRKNATQRDLLEAILWSD